MSMSMIKINMDYTVTCRMTFRIFFLLKTGELPLSVSIYTHISTLYIFDFSINHDCPPAGIFYYEELKTFILLYVVEGKSTPGCYFISWIFHFSKAQK